MRFLIAVLALYPGLVPAEQQCPSSFDAFLSRFEGDTAFQQQNTVYPLKHSFVDLDAVPEPKIVDKPLSRSAVAARGEPIYPLLVRQQAEALIKNVETVSPARRTVHLHRPDSGYTLIYRFEQLKGCWKLVEFEDPST